MIGFYIIIKNNWNSGFTFVFVILCDACITHAAAERAYWVGHRETGHEVWFRDVLDDQELKIFFVDQPWWPTCFMLYLPRNLVPLMVSVVFKKFISQLQQQNILSWKVTHVRNKTAFVRNYKSWLTLLIFTRMSYILKQTCSFLQQVCLSMDDLNFWQLLLWPAFFPFITKTSSHLSSLEICEMLPNPFLWKTTWLKVFHPQVERSW